MTEFIKEAYSGKNLKLTMVVVAILALLNSFASIEEVDAPHPEEVITSVQRVPSE